MRHDAVASIAALIGSKFAFGNAAVTKLPAVLFFDCIVLCAFFPGCSKAGPVHRMPWVLHEKLYSCEMENASLLAGMSDFWQERPFKRSPRHAGKTEYRRGIHPGGIVLHSQLINSIFTQRPLLPAAEADCARTVGKSVYLIFTAFIWASTPSSAALKQCAWVMAFSVRFMQS